MWKKSLAFTMGEVLIAVTIIGAVASMVLPKIILGQKSSQLHAQFNTAYSLLSSAVANMDANNISIKPTSYNSVKDFFAVLKNYEKVSNNCGENGLCEPSPEYSNLQNLDAFVLNNGMLFIAEKAPTTKSVITLASDFDFTSIGGSVQEDGTIKISSNSVRKTHLKNSTDVSEYTEGSLEEGNSLYNFENANEDVILITIDINGNRKSPNMRGYDVFTFQLINEGIVPVGSINSFTNVKCNLSNSASVYAAMACTQDAATNENYFKDLYSNR